MAVNKVNLNFNVESGSVIKLPKGTTVINEPIWISDVDNPVIEGKHSTLIYEGPPCESMVMFERCWQPRFEDTRLICGSEGVKRAVTLTNKPGSNQDTGRVSSGAKFYDISVMHGGYPTAVDTGFAVDSFLTGGLDGNNDHHYFERCFVQSCKKYCYFVNGSQCHNLIFERCGGTDAIKRRPVGFYAKHGVFFSFNNGSMNSTSCDFLLGSAEVNFKLNNFNSEHSNRFIVTETSNPYIIDANMIRWDGEPIGDNKVIYSVHGGPTSLKNASFAGINGRCPELDFYANPYHQNIELNLSAIFISQYYGGNNDVKPLQIRENYNKNIGTVKYMKINDDGTRFYQDVVPNMPLDFNQQGVQ